MSGVSALSGARGGVVAAPNSTDPMARNLGRVEVVEVEVQDTTWALTTPWYEQILLNGLHDPWERRLDCFVADCDDPRLWEIIERVREQWRRSEPPGEIPEVVDIPEAVEPATGESGIVELILESDRSWREGSFIDHGNDLLVDLIRLERARW